jgi:hypothetical protein
MTPICDTSTPETCTDVSRHVTSCVGEILLTSSRKLQTHQHEIHRDTGQRQKDSKPQQKGNMMGQIQRAVAEMVEAKSEHLLANMLARKMKRGQGQCRRTGLLLSMENVLAR